MALLGSFDCPRNKCRVSIREEGSSWREARDNLQDVAGKDDVRGDGMERPDPLSALGDQARHELDDREHDQDQPEDPVRRFEEWFAMFQGREEPEDEGFNDARVNEIPAILR